MLSVKVHGFSEVGQLGYGLHGPREGQARPVRVRSSATWKSVTAKMEHTFGIKSDDTLWAWGGDKRENNKFGYLGLGNTGNKNKPTQVAPGTKWKAVYAGEYHTVGIQTDGTLWAWGYNSNGQLGLEDTTDKHVPTQVGSAKWQSVAAGWKITFGIKADNTLWAWGSNKYSQLGLGTGGDKSYKTRLTKVGIATNWSMVFAGDEHAFGIQTDGKLYAWGTDNEYSQIGFGFNTNKRSPTQVGTAKWKAIAASETYTVGIQTDDTLWAWGNNAGGQLGNGKSGSGKGELRPILVE